MTDQPHAVTYVVLTRRGTTAAWEHEDERTFEVPEAAIEYARHLLDTRHVVCALVRERTPEEPTPIYQGVGRGYYWRAFFPAHSREDVETRP